MHVNVDSTGGIGATVLTDSATATELAAVAAAAVHAETGAAHAGKRTSRSSDMSFWGVGIPSLFGSLSHQPPSTVAMRNPLGWWWHTPHDLIDKIDPAHLLRDTRVFVRALGQLLTSDVLPLDIAAQAANLLAQLEPLAPELSGRIHLAALTEAVRALRTAAAAGPHGDQALMAASRALVPLDYTSGDRFRHDPALPQPPWPALQPLRDLAAAPAGDAALFAAVDARRAVNRVHHAVREATRALRS